MHEAHWGLPLPKYTEYVFAFRSLYRCVPLESARRLSFRLAAPPRARFPRRRRRRRRRRLAPLHVHACTGISSHGVLTALRFPTELLLAYSQDSTYKPRIKSSFKATRDGWTSGGELEGSRGRGESFRQAGSMSRGGWTPKRGENFARPETRVYRGNAGIRPRCGSTDGELQRGIVGIAPRRPSRCISEECRKFSGKLRRIREGEIRARAEINVVSCRDFESANSRAGGPRAWINSLVQRSRHREDLANIPPPLRPALAILRPRRRGITTKALAPIQRYGISNPATRNLRAERSSETDLSGRSASLPSKPARHPRPELIYIEITEIWTRGRERHAGRGDTTGKGAILFGIRWTLGRKSPLRKPGRIRSACKRSSLRSRLFRAVSFGGG